MSLLDAAAPGFRKWSESDDQLFDSKSLQGVFAAYSHFVDAAAPTAVAWPELAEFTNEAVGGRDAELSEAVCTCFLENLARPGHPLGSLLCGEAQRYWRQWSGAP